LKTLVVIPTYNEAQSLASTVEGLLTEVAGVDVLVVDDNSQDGTAAIADSLGIRHARVSALHRPAKQGLGPAYIDGFSYAFANGYEIVVEMDADGSHQASDLQRVLLAISSADLVIGSRWISGGSVQNWPDRKSVV
jgi:dolichol-phosphate mannosyltransferase